MSCDRVIMVGSRVEVDGRAGLVAMDNDDGTWNIEFDCGDEGNIPEDNLCLLADQSLDSFRNSTIQVPRDLPSGIRIVADPTAEVKPHGWTRFVCFSDTHGLHGDIPQEHMPAADILLHAGDFTNTGELEQIQSFSAWLQAYPAAHKIVIAGNHDITFDAEYYVQRGGARFHNPPFDHEKARRLLTGCEYLEDSSTNVCGYSVYGSPWQPEFCDWAFNLTRGESCREKWQAIPQELDILMTHGPPEGFGDMCSSGLRAGCPDLRKAIEKRVVSVSVSGHIHSGYGCRADEATLFINASTCTSDYRASNPPIVFDAPPVAELRTATRNAAKVKKGMDISER